MKISDEISLSARNLLRRKGRTALTLVGVVIGTCMVVLMISLGIAQNQANDEMIQSWGDLTQIEIYGGGISIGHPLGATGAILTIKVMYELQRTDKKDAMISMCIGGGQGISMYFTKP